MERLTLSRQTNIIESDPNATLYGRVQYRRLGAAELYLQFDWNNNLSSSNATINLAGGTTDTGAYWGGTIYWGGTWYYGQGFQYSGNVSSQGFSPGGKEYGFKLTTYLSTTADFKIDHIDL